MFEKCALHRVEFAAVRQTFDGSYLLALGIAGEHETGAHRTTIDQYGAGTTDSHATAFHGTLKREILA
jgi:hypothetical protein